MAPLHFLLPVLYALFIWWFTTGLIIVIYGRAPAWKSLGFGVATIALCTAFLGVWVTRQLTEPLHVYLAVTCGVVIWGWQTASYYLGFITGPRPMLEGEPPRSLMQRFRLALQSSLYHEMTVIGFALLLISITWAQPNQWALWVFLALWIMHSVAKLNVFLGVRNFRVEFLPEHLHHLAALLSERANNPLLPFTIIMAGSIALLFVYQGIIPQTTPGQTVGFLLVGTMIALGVLEILLLVLPLPVTLWGWGYRSLPERVVKG